MGLPEELAAAVLGLLPGVDVTETDVPGAPPSTCDLLVTTANSNWAVEVTRAMDPVAAASWGAAAKLDWHLPGLRSCWALVAEDGFRSTRVHNAAAEALPRLDSLGVFSIPQLGLPHTDSVAQPLLILERAGVNHGSSYPAPSGMTPWVDIGTSRSGFAPSSDLAYSLQAEIDKTDNRRKLLRSGAEEHHLFIWVEDDSSYPAMHDTDTEGVSITLPTEIDVVWAARTLKGDWPITHLWRFENGEWKVLYRYGMPLISDMTVFVSP